MMQHGKSPQDQLTYLWVAIFGVTGANGLNGTVKSQAESIKALEQTARRHDALEAQILFVWAVVRWVSLAALTTIGLLVSGPLGDFAKNLLGGGK